MKRSTTKTLKTQLLALETFSSDAFLSINKRLLSKYGPELAVYLCNLVDKLNYFIRKGDIGEDMSFYLTYSDQMAQTGMSEYQLRKCKNKLKEMGVLKTEMRGIPPKEYYILDLNKVVEEFLRDIPLVFKGINPKKLKELSPQKLKEYKDTVYKDTVYKDTILGTKVPLQPNGCNGEDAISHGASHIIEFWGNLSNKTIRHRQGSKVYHTAAQYLDRLMNGLPILPKSDNKPDQPHQKLLNFCSKYDIPTTILYKKWPEETIKDILQQIEQELSEERSHALTDVLWNGFVNGQSGFSLFLYNAARSETPQKRLSEVHLSMADKLADAIGVSLKEAKRIAWAREFQALCEEKGKTVQQVNEVLDWYMKNYDYPKVRSVADAQEFCDYYNRIRKSMQIAQEEGGNGRKLTQAIHPPKNKAYLPDTIMYEEATHG